MIREQVLLDLAAVWPGAALSNHPVNMFEQAAVVRHVLQVAARTAAVDEVLGTLVALSLVR